MRIILGSLLPRINHSFTRNLQLFSVTLKSARDLFLPILPASKCQVVT